MFIPHNNKSLEVRVCCLVHTAPAYFETRARAVNSTWGPRCDGLFFITELSNDTKGLPIASIANITPGYEHLTQKSTFWHFNMRINIILILSIGFLRPMMIHT